MLSNVEPIEELRALSRAKARDYDTKTVHHLATEEELEKGWEIEKKNDKSVRLSRRKAHGVYFEDRVWSLLYRMKFAYLSGKGGAGLLLNSKDDAGPKTQIDVVGIDDDVAVAIECKSSETAARRPQFQEELGKHVLIRERFSQSIARNFGAKHKRQAVLVMFLENVILSANDRERAKTANVVVFDEKDLSYYEHLSAHLGPAAKFQLFADMLPGKAVPGLGIRVPAIRAKMGGAYCYTFSISPEYLLKISYVSHRSKGKASDVNTYQRMLSRSRLNNIREYIDDDGIFPTNIVVNLDSARLRFERIRQETEDDFDQEKGLLGWLEIRAAYKSAWIIDGQHRLFAYSGHPNADKGLLSVLAFEGLSPSKQAELFIDINAKQKSVKRSLLQELYAELHWDAEEPEVRVRAIVSKAIQELDADPECALYGRIQTADAMKDAKRCISLTSLYGAIDRTEFHIAKEKKGHVIEYGPLWAGTNEATLRRTVYLLKRWFNTIRDHAPEWWEKGADDGGGLAMNDGVATCVNVLRTVFAHFDHVQRLVQLDDEDLFTKIQPFAEALGQYLRSLSEEERKRFRDLRGVQGQTTRTRRCQQAIRERIPTFNPSGLEEFLSQEKSQTNLRAKELIDRIERTLQKVVLEELHREFGDSDNEWWLMGVPKTVRLKVTQRFEEDDGKRGAKENYFDLMDYRKIAQENWNLFEPLLSFGTGSKDKRTVWMAYVNEKRNIVSHPSSGVFLSVEELGQVQQYDQWFFNQLSTPKVVGRAAGATE